MYTNCYPELYKQRGNTEFQAKHYDGALNYYLKALFSADRLKKETNQELFTAQVHSNIAFVYLKFEVAVLANKHATRGLKIVNATDNPETGSSKIEKKMALIKKKLQHRLVLAEDLENSEGKVGDSPESGKYKMTNKPIIGAMLFDMFDTDCSGTIKSSLVKSLFKNPEDIQRYNGIWYDPEIVFYEEFDLIEEEIDHEEKPTYKTVDIPEALFKPADVIVSILKDCRRADNYPPKSCEKVFGIVKDTEIGQNMLGAYFGLFMVGVITFADVRHAVLRGTLPESFRQWVEDYDGYWPAERQSLYIQMLLESNFRGIPWDRVVLRKLALPE